jgi:hypothetical protein
MKAMKILDITLLILIIVLLIMNSIDKNMDAVLGYFTALFLVFRLLLNRKY